MECPGCGFNNLPGLARCASCGRVLETAAGGPTYPPRAPKGALALFGRRFLRAQRVLVSRSRIRAFPMWHTSAVRAPGWEAARLTRRDKAAESVRQLSRSATLGALVGCVPGLPRILRWEARGAALLGGAVALALAAWGLVHTDAFWPVMWLLGLLALCSVVDGATCFAQARAGRALTGRERVAVALIGLAVGSSLWVGRWLAVYRAELTVSVPVASLVPGDELLVVRDWAHPGPYRTGDVVMISPSVIPSGLFYALYIRGPVPALVTPGSRDNPQPALEKVRAILGPSAAVEWAGMRESAEEPGPPIRLTVAIQIPEAGYPLGVSGPEATARGPVYVLDVHPDYVQGQILAITNPTPRRRWL